MAVKPRERGPPSAAPPMPPLPAVTAMAEAEELDTGVQPSRMRASVPSMVKLLQKPSGLGASPARFKQQLISASRGALESASVKALEALDKGIRERYMYDYHQRNAAVEPLGRSVPTLTPLG
eukprot:CAMPEP_0174743282 /NCGR_PEP_ID=MMETSP1094-20130205/81241_1 /TAXON_ID=156173 /ORGANISM="Chrysochromulina brevifilum, Strain UTEX LB 985" /LENGTH=121 /DNA_ID=CAMNT_0015947477 /DNA_START=48 /DNA_END=409 /DNA_ORIENTATION=+